MKNTLLATGILLLSASASYAFPVHDDNANSKNSTAPSKYKSTGLKITSAPPLWKKFMNNTGTMQPNNTNSSKDNVPQLWEKFMNNTGIMQPKNTNSNKNNESNNNGK